MLSLLLVLGQLLSVAVTLDFGDSIPETQLIKVTALERSPEVPEISKFDVYRGEGDEDRIRLEVSVLMDPSTSDDVRGINIIDFRQYSSKSSPIVNDTIQLGFITNCSNIGEELTLDSMFLTEPGFIELSAGDTASLFFQPSFAVKDNKTQLLLKHDGPLHEFSRCETATGQGVWRETPGIAGTTEQTAVLVVNNVLIRRSEEGNNTIYQESYFSTTFTLTWRISQYIFVEGVVASQKRVSADLMYASVQPEWDNNVLTGRTVVHLGVRTTLENAYYSYFMMGYQQYTAALDILVGGQQVIIDASSTPTSDVRDNPCTKRINYQLGEFESQSYDCEQVWEFSFVLPESVTTGSSEVVGGFFYFLDLYGCDDLEVLPEDLNCGIVDAAKQSITEQIYADISLDTIVEVTSERDNVMKMSVTAIKSKDGSAQFLHGEDITRGIYHKEEVVIIVAPPQNYSLIQKYGVKLAAFIVCIQSDVPIGSKLGCLDVAEESRYIAFMEDDLAMSVRGKMYKRSDFEEAKQSLSSHSWDPKRQFYTIEFTNLALSARSRLYKITMIFQIDYNVTEVERNSNLRKRALVLGDSFGEEEEEEEDELFKRDSGPGVGGTVVSMINGTDNSTIDSSTTPDNSTTSDNSTATSSNSSTTSSNSTATSDDSTGTSDDSSERSGDFVSDANVKSGGCPEGTVYVDLDSDCKVAASSAEGITRLSLVIVLLYNIIVSL